MKSYYDYVIVGAGPAGLALTQYLHHTTNKILLVDSLDVIGGCHRVVRVPYQKQELFTEHGPRIYVDNYNNFKILLKEMGHDFYSLFTPYHYSFIKEIFRHITTFTWKELVILMSSFLLFLINEQYGKKITLLEFGKKHHFRSLAIDMMDRIARLTDGASIDRYSLNQFFQLLNQRLFYKIYQPNMPNDKGFLKIWKHFLNQQSNVDIALEHDVIHLSYNKEINSIHSLWMVDKKNHNTIEIKCNQVVLAVPPHAIARIIGNCHKNIQNSFMPYQRLLRFVKNTDYIPYISITYHWKTKQKISLKHGFPTGEWGVIYIVLSDYMDMNDEYSKTLVSCCVSYTDRPSRNTGKTANQSTAEEVMEETFQQLKTVMPFLTKPNVTLISPQNYYDMKTKQWKQYDVSYFNSSQEDEPFPTHGNVKNLYNVGTHNRNSLHEFTTLESTVSNSLSLAYQLEPKTRKQYPFQTFWTLRDVIKILFILMIFLLLIIIFIIFMKKKKIKNRI